MNSQVYKISGSLIQAYLICPRQSWLMSRNLTGDQYNDFLAIGRLLSEETYSRDKKEIRIDNNVIDVIKKSEGDIILVETKKSSRAIETAKMQLLFYIYNLRYKVNNLKAEIRIPKEKKIISVELTDESIIEIENIISKINDILSEERPPKMEKIKYCKNCSHSEFCWA